MEEDSANEVVSNPPNTTAGGVGPNTGPAIVSSGCDCGGGGTTDCKCSDKTQCTCGTKGDCSCAEREHPSESLQYVYAVGRIGVDFFNRGNLEYLVNSSGFNPEDLVTLHNYLVAMPPSDPGYRQRIATSQNVIWTVEVDGEPIYAIQPTGAFARDTYEVLLSFLRDQVIGSSEPSASKDKKKPEGQKAEVVAIPGLVIGSTVLYRAGKTVPLVSPALVGMHNWSVGYLIAAATAYISEYNSRVPEGRRITLPEETEIENFAQILADQYRNFGMAPSDRARNFVASHLADPIRILAEWMAKGMVLDEIRVQPSDMRPAGTDRWDVVLRFFDPRNQLGVAATEVPIVVDVNYLVPNIVNIGPARRRSMRVI